MAQVSLHGSWHVRVVAKDSDWPQRVVITGSMNAVIPGVVGASATVGRESWDLAIEHDPGGGWRPSAYVQAGPVKESDGRPGLTVVSKDHYWAGDGTPNDLVLKLAHVGKIFEVTGLPEIVDDSHGGVRSGTVADGRPFLAITVRNTGYRAFDYDTVLDITDAGRDALSRCGVVVDETWDPEALRVTGQEAFGRAAGVRPLDVGEQGAVYFPVDVGTAAPGAAADVEVVMFQAGGGKRRERQVVRVANLVPGAPPPPADHAPAGLVPGTGPSAPAGALRVSGDVVGVHARTRPPEYRTGPAVATPGRPGAGASGGGTTR
jgi:hypothetical protein